MQNGHVERLNSTFREDVLNAFLFETLEQLRILCDKWVYDYNNMKPNSVLRSMAPSIIAKNNRILTIQLN
jgi:putative transposase